MRTHLKRLFLTLRFLDSPHLNTHQDKALTWTKELHNGITFMERLVSDLTTYWQIAYGKSFDCQDYFFSRATLRPRMSHLTLETYERK